MLDVRVAALEHKLIATMERGFRNQTWRLMGAIFVALAVSVTLARV
jgi:hypothetical protein